MASPFAMTADGYLRELRSRARGATLRERIVLVPAKSAAALVRMRKAEEVTGLGATQRARWRALVLIGCIERRG